MIMMETTKTTYSKTCIVVQVPKTRSKYNLQVSSRDRYRVPGQKILGDQIVDRGEELVRWYGNVVKVQFLSK